MNILLLGATGFIGSGVAARLAADGHKVTGLGRNPTKAAHRHQAIRWLHADLAQMTRPADWQALLEDQHVVVNCAGALQDGLADNLAATQSKAMRALYAAIQQSTPRLVVQISARTNGAAGDLPFLATKREADEALASSGLPYIILRPALVLGRNAHGGSALLRALAAFPLVLPLIHARSPVETVSVDDVATAVVAAVGGKLPPGTDMNLAADGTMSLVELVGLHRQWLGLSPAPVVRVPAWLARPVTWLADLAGLLGWRSPLRSTAMAVMSEGIKVDVRQTTSWPATSATIVLAANLSGVQDLWFARLYLLKPLLIAGLCLFWLLSGLIPLLSPHAAATHFLPFMPPHAAMTATLATCLIDIALGLAVVIRPFARRALLGMLAVSLVYLCGGSLLEPALWLDPLGPYVKVLPSMLLALVTLAILDDR